MHEYLDWLQVILHMIDCRYQPPIPADQVKPLTEYDYEGGKNYNIYYCLVIISPFVIANEPCFLCTQRARQTCEGEVVVVVEGAEVEVRICASGLLQFCYGIQKTCFYQFLSFFIYRFCSYMYCSSKIVEKYNPLKNVIFQNYVAI